MPIGTDLLFPAYLDAEDHWNDGKSAPAARVARQFGRGKRLGCFKSNPLQSDIVGTL